MFDEFLMAFTPERTRSGSAATTMSAKVAEELGSPVPREIERFWSEVGTGYFGERVLYVFGDEPGAARDTLIDWNRKDFWDGIYPPPSSGGPVFFAETCFGDQLGYRWEPSGEPVYVLFCVDTFDAFAVERGEGKLFSSLLVERHALMDEDRYKAVRALLGPLRSGMHYAPVVSPFFGGTGQPDNFCLETANVHFRTAIATYRAMKA